MTFAVNSSVNSWIWTFAIASRQLWGGVMKRSLAGCSPAPYTVAGEAQGERPGGETGGAPEEEV